MHRLFVNIQQRPREKTQTARKTTVTLLRTPIRHGAARPASAASSRCPPGRFRRTSCARRAPWARCTPATARAGWSPTRNWHQTSERTTAPPAPCTLALNRPRCVHRGLVPGSNQLHRDVVPPQAHLSADHPLCWRTSKSRPAKHVKPPNSPRNTCQNQLLVRQQPLSTSNNTKHCCCRSPGTLRVLGALCRRKVQRRVKANAALAGWTTRRAAARASRS